MKRKVRKIMTALLFSSAAIAFSAVGLLPSFGKAGNLIDFFGAARSVSEVETCVPPPSGMVAWYPGDGNADDIIGGNNGTLQNGATFASGMVDQAFSLDGIDDYVNIADTAALHLTTFTIDASVNST